MQESWSCMFIYIFLNFLGENAPKVDDAPWLLTLFTNKNLLKISESVSGEQNGKPWESWGGGVLGWGTCEMIK